MHQRISTTLKTLRQDLATGLGGDFIVKACRAAGHTWSDSCPLDSGGHHSLSSSFRSSTATPPCTHVSLLAGRRASPRPHSVRHVPHSRWPSIGRSSAKWVKGLIPATEKVGLWACGHRTFLEDGSRRSPCPIPQELQAHFGQPGGQAKAAAGFPIAHTSWALLFHAGTGLLLEVIAAAVAVSCDMAGVLGILPSAHGRRRLGG